MKQKIIVDTSIWIEYFKNNDTVARIIDEGLDTGTIYIAGPVISELLQGVKSNRELSMLEKYIDAVPYLECKMDDWTEAGHVSFSLRKIGITIPLTDIIIYSIAKKNDAMIFTRDKHFNLIPNIKLFETLSEDSNLL
ncbi:MAG: PIN domain-containing protein [Clostridia bacterium]|jgi:predicted nucleic acid-binding protein|nr:PIN domain-containing protein [Clostridia bacterium]